MTPATIWIENNPQTGEVKPWEVWFQAAPHPKHRTASCETEEGARASMARCIKRCEKQGHYSVTVRT